jgi:hypothetical protein
VSSRTELINNYSTILNGRATFKIVVNRGSLYQIHSVVDGLSLSTASLWVELTAEVMHSVIVDVVLVS